MSNSDKAVKSSQAKTLYDDLRNRHEGVKESIAPEYADLTFPVTQGAHCFHDGVYYKAKQNIQTSEDWTAAHWETDTIEAELSSQKSAINSTATEETGQALLMEEERETIILATALDNIDYLIAHLPQDSSLMDIVEELQTENAWLDMIYNEMVIKEAASA